MSQTDYNISDNVEDSWRFRLVDSTKKSYAFEMRYPLVEDIEKIQNMIGKQNDAATEEEKIEQSKKVQEFMYGFITPTDKNTKTIHEVLQKSNIKVFNNFNMMVQKEFGIS